jgi:HK97 family phage major capsid protein
LTSNVGEPTAVILHPRDEGTLSGLTDTTDQPLALPPRLVGLPMLTTTQIPTDGGAGDDESKIIVGDFRKLLIGMREDIRIEILRERYADNHQVAFIAHMRADIAVQHAAAFHVITGVQG